MPCCHWHTALCGFSATGTDRIRYRVTRNEALTPKDTSLAAQMAGAGLCLKSSTSVFEPPINHFQPHTDWRGWALTKSVWCVLQPVSCFSSVSGFPAISVRVL